MRDVNSAILQVYYEAINALDIPVYEGEEPDNLKDKIYVVLSDAVSKETSTDNSSDVQLTIQISIHSWDYKYNNTKTLNDTAGAIIEAIKPTSTSVLDLSPFDLQMLNLSLQTDIVNRLGEINGRKYITRILIFKQDIFVIS
jgi:hypothetical protein